MPAVKKGDLILVSGASGFIAVHLCKDLLEKGYRVRGTVRSEGKGQYLKDLFKGKDFEYVIVDDITKDGIFDESVKGVDAVAHTASPFHYNTNDPKDLIDPAYKGTTGILKSIQKNNPDIKRLVVTSSAASVMSTLSKPAGTKYTEKDWNEDSIGEVEKGGDHATPQQAYLASKTMAERALWDFVEKEKPSWDAATICPPSVWGAVLQQVDKKENLNTSVERFRCWAGGDKKEEDLPGFIGNWVAVRDVSHAHIAALEVPEAGGERFITSNGPVCGQDLVDIIHKNHPQLKGVAVGKAGSGAEIDATKDVFIGKKATDVLGIHYKSLEDTVAEMVESLSGKGWL